MTVTLWKEKALLALTSTALIAWLFFANNIPGAAPYSDGGGHLVTGLFLADWVRAGLPFSPIPFALEYFRHLPYVGFGLWPPLFHIIEATLFLLLGDSITIAMMLVSGTILFAALLLGFTLLEGKRNPIIVGLGIVLFIASPLSQSVQTNLLIDGLVCLLCFAAVLSFQRHLSILTWKQALITALICVLALYSKGNAMQLMLAFPLVGILGGNARQLLHRKTIFIAITCAVLAGPWYVMTTGLTSQGFLYAFGFETILGAFKENVRTIFNASPLLCMAAVVALFDYAKCRLDGKQVSEDLSAPLISALIATLIFHALIPAGFDRRYMLLGFLSVTGLGIVGIQRILWLTSGYANRGMGRAAFWGVVLLLIGQGMYQLRNQQPERPVGIIEAAVAIAKLLPQENRSVLIAGDFIVESAVGPALAYLDGNRRGTESGMYVVRGSRAFAGGGYRNDDYQPLFPTETSMADEIARLAPSIIVSSLAPSDHRWHHVGLIQAMLEARKTPYKNEFSIEYLPGKKAQVWMLEREKTRPVVPAVVSRSNNLRSPRAAKLLQ